MIFVTNIRYDWTVVWNLQILLCLFLVYFLHRAHTKLGSYMHHLCPLNGCHHFDCMINIFFAIIKYQPKHRQNQHQHWCGQHDQHGQHSLHGQWSLCTGRCYHKNFRIMWKTQMIGTHLNDADANGVCGLVFSPWKRSLQDSSVADF